ncbi:MAG: AhpC/TSA family protein [Bacteroidales bacterium]|nr:AhpC/TSA family protein [Bacteroidales bacterium]
MKNFLLGLSFLLLIVFAGCKNEVTYKAGPATLAGSIVGAENQQLYIRKETINQNELDTILVSMNGSFSFTTNLNKPEYFTLFIGRDQLVIYMKPNDTVSFNADIQRFDEIKFSGNSSVYNDYLVKLTKNQGAYSASLQNIFRADEKIVSKSMDSVRAAHLADLEVLEKNFGKTDPIFITTEKNRILYYWGVNHLLFPLYHGYLNQIENYEPSPDFSAYMNELNLNDSSLLSIPEYRQFVSNFLSSKVNSYFYSDSLQVSQPSFTAYQLNMANTLFSDKNVKSYLAFRILKDHVLYDGVKDYDIIMPIFNELCLVEAFKAEIQNDLKDWELLKKGMPSNDFAGVNLKGDSIRLSDFTGKYVYVDVWATWCQPCLREIPFLLEMDETFKEKNIVFLGVSVDRDKDKWVERVEQGGLAGTQIYVGLSDELSGYYKISGIPRFMLFDKDGNILEVSADRPSSGVSRKLMNLEGL